MLAERLAALGATVVAGCYTEKGRQELQAAIPTGVVLPLDVTNQASVDAFAAETLRRFPEIWGLVNNAYGSAGRCARQQETRPRRSY